LPTLTRHLQPDEDAEWLGWGETPIVAHFAEPQAEYAAIRKAAGLMYRPERGVIHAHGKDALAFLNNLLTNGLIHPETKAGLPSGHGCYNFLLNLKGRIVADLRVLRPEASDDLILEVDRSSAEMLVDAIDRFRFTEKVKLADASSGSVVLNLHGPEALSVLSEAADAPFTFEETPDPFPATADLPCGVVRLAGVEATVFRDDMCGVPGIGLIVPEDHAVAVWEDLTVRFGGTTDGRPYGNRRLRPVGWAMFNACRVEAGRPILGVDFAASQPSRPGPKRDDGPEPKGGTLPAETGPLFDLGVSVTSGCYLGQEVVARMHARRVVAKQIVGLRMDGESLPAAGSPVEVDGKQVGAVTSSTISPTLSNACLALATIKRPHFEPGTKVTLVAEADPKATATVVPMPFL
jgi:folate-binding protein YgfZ